MDKLKFAKADSIARSFTAEHIKNLPLLVHGLTSNLDSDVQKFRAIYTWVCTHVKSDYRSYTNTLNKRKRFSKKPQKFKEWNDTYLPKVFKRLIEHRTTACTGYSYLVRQMALLADLQCEIVDGFGRTATTEFKKNATPNHSWNAIKLDDIWFLCDATWSAGRIVFDEDIPRFQFDYSDGYFLARPKLFSKNHYPVDKKWLLLDEAFSFQDFVNGPLIYKGAFEHQIIPVYPENMIAQADVGKPVPFRFSMANALEGNTIKLLIMKGDSKSEHEYNPVKSASNYTVHHIFDKSGVYDVHVMLDGTPAITYTVRVTKNSSYP